MGLVVKELHILLLFAIGYPLTHRIAAWAGPSGFLV
jgi:hypothetical protein